MYYFIVKNRTKNLINSIGKKYFCRLRILLTAEKIHLYTCNIMVQCYYIEFFTMIFSRYDI